MLMQPSTLAFVVVIAAAIGNGAYATNSPPMSPSPAAQTLTCAQAQKYWKGAGCCGSGNATANPDLVAKMCSVGQDCNSGKCGSDCTCKLANYMGT